MIRNNYKKLFYIKQQEVSKFSQSEYNYFLNALCDEAESAAILSFIACSSLTKLLNLSIKSDNIIIIINNNKNQDKSIPFMISVVKLDVTAELIF